MDLAAEIKAYLERNNMSQKEYAELADVREGYLCDILRGRIKSPGTATKQRLKGVMVGKTYPKLCSPPEECFVCKYPDCIRKDGNTRRETEYIKAAEDIKTITTGHVPQGKLSSSLRSGWM